MKVRLLVLVLLPILVLVSTLGSHFLEFGSLFDSFWWTIVTFTTVGYGDLSPASVGGRMFGVIVLITGVIIHSIIISLVSNWYFHFQSARDRGLKHVNAKNHILICSNDADLVQSILDEYADARPATKVVIVSSGNGRPLHGTRWRKSTPWVNGEGNDPKALRMASASRCRAAFIAYESDSETVMTVMQLRNLTRGRARILAVTSSADHRQHLEDAGASYILHPGDIYVPLMVKASISPAAPEWIRQVILSATTTPTIENRPVPSGSSVLNWRQLVEHLRNRHQVLPLGIVGAGGAMHTNPLSDHRLEKGDRLLVLAPPRSAKAADKINLRCAHPPTGPILVSSDRPEFISRVLAELDRASVTNEIVVLSEVEPFGYLSDRASYRYRWVHASSFSNDGLKLANAEAARIAFIDHKEDRHTLMAVLRLESISKEACFAIASYRQPGFDERLQTAGCDFALNANELIAPLLTQTARHQGIAALVEEIISQHPRSESLFVKELSPEWRSRTWLETLSRLKRQYEYLPVALIDPVHHSLIVCPTNDTRVEPGHGIVFLTLTGNGARDDVFVEARRPTAAIEDDFEHRFAADPEAAVAALQAAAERGDSGAQSILAGLYETGKGVNRSPALAFRWHECAGRKGHARSLFKIGTFYLQGFGARPDQGLARHYMQRSAKQGYLPAQRALAMLKERRMPVGGNEFLNHDLIHHLTPEQKGAYIKAVIRMMSVHGELGSYEQGYLKEVVQTTRDDRLIHDIEQAVLSGEALEIPAVEGLSSLEQKLILEELVTIALADGVLSARERELLVEVGRRIGAAGQLVHEQVRRAGV